MVRLAIWHLRTDWSSTLPVTERLAAVSGWIAKEMGGVSATLDQLRDELAKYPQFQPSVREEFSTYAADNDTIAF
jgi:hypothetical protein